MNFASFSMNYGELLMNVASFNFINGDDIVNADLYYLVSRQGKGNKPSVADSTFVTYRGSLLNGLKFDEKVYPVWFDLISVVRGFREVLPEFSDGTFSIRADGTFDFKDYGQGIFFIPSSLGYFSNNKSINFTIRSTSN